jgi:fructoselysine-6-P-deglycase FrlB-like protein
MGQNSDLVLPIFAGEEASISNKTYTNTLAVLLLLETSLTGDNPETELDQLGKVAEIMQEGLAESHEKARLAAEFLGNPSTLHVLARGRDLVSARQLALIAKEGAGLFTEALSAGLFRHGPIELAGPKHNALFLVSRGSKIELTEKLAREVRELGSRVVVATEQGRPDSRMGNGILALQLPTGEAPSRYFPILSAPFIEYFVHEVAKMKGQEAGVFQHAQKITDRE